MSLDKVVKEKGSNSLVGGRLDRGLKGGPLWGELEIFYICWFIVEEGTQKFRKIGILEWIVI